jgi:hypothetical protein
VINRKSFLTHKAFDPLPLLLIPENHSQPAAGSARFRFSSSLKTTVTGCWNSPPPLKNIPEYSTPTSLSRCFTATTSHKMTWKRTEAGIVEMLQTCRNEPEKQVTDLTTWLERQKLILLESEIWATTLLK